VRKTCKTPIVSRDGDDAKSKKANLESACAAREGA